MGNPTPRDLKPGKGGPGRTNCVEGFVRNAPLPRPQGRARPAITLVALPAALGTGVGLGTCTPPLYERWRETLVCADFVASGGTNAQEPTSQTLFQ